MSSIVSDPNGRKRLLFFDPSGQRRAIRLGKVQMRHAEAIRAKVDALLSAATTRQPPDRETSEWVISLTPELHGTLAAAGLLKSRAHGSLDKFLSAFMAGRAGLKPESRRKLEQTCNKLLARFGGGCLLHDIAPPQAYAWRQELLASGLSEASVKTHTGNAKVIFAEAVRLGHVPASPFASLKGGSTPTRNTRYVTPAETVRVIDACPNAQWRLLVGLARYAGLRTPSEIRPLTWSDIDWRRGRMRVQSPKTERHAGHESRLVPIDQRLMKLLVEVRPKASPDEPRIVTIHSIAGRRAKMLGIMRRADVEPWDDTWQTLRRSCEIEWAQRYPQYAVSLWIGHSITVSGRHYANAVPDDLFDRAAGLASQPDAPSNAAGTSIGHALRDSEKSTPEAIQRNGSVPPKASPSARAMPDRRGNGTPGPSPLPDAASQTVSFEQAAQNAAQQPAELSRIASHRAATVLRGPSSKCR